MTDYYLLLWSGTVTPIYRNDRFDGYYIFGNGCYNSSHFKFRNFCPDELEEAFLAAERFDAVLEIQLETVEDSTLHLIDIWLEDWVLKWFGLGGSPITPSKVNECPSVIWHSYDADGATDWFDGVTLIKKSDFYKKFNKYSLLGLSALGKINNLPQTGEYGAFSELKDLLNAQARFEEFKSDNALEVQSDQRIENDTDNWKITEDAGWDKREIKKSMKILLPDIEEVSPLKFGENNKWKKNPKAKTAKNRGKGFEVTYKGRSYLIGKCEYDGDFKIRYWVRVLRDRDSEKDYSHSPAYFYMIKTAE